MGNIGRGGVDPTGQNYKVYQRLKKKKQLQDLKVSSTPGDGGFTPSPQDAKNREIYSKALNTTVPGVSRDRISDSILAADAAWRERTGTSIDPAMMMAMIQSQQQLPSTKEEWLALFGDGADGPVQHGMFVNNHAIVGADGRPAKIHGKLSTMFNMTGIDITEGMLGSNVMNPKGWTREGMGDWVKDTPGLPAPGKMRTILRQLDEKVRFDLEELSPEQKNAYQLMNYGIVEWKRMWKNVLIDRGVPGDQLRWDANNPEWNDYFDNEFHKYMIGRILPYTQQNEDQTKKERAQRLMQELMPGVVTQGHPDPEKLEDDIHIVTQLYMQDALQSVGGPENADETYKEILFRGYVDGRLPGQAVTKARWDYVHEFGTDFLPAHALKKCEEEVFLVEDAVGKVFTKLDDIGRWAYNLTPWELLIDRTKDKPGALGDFMSTMEKVSEHAYKTFNGEYLFGAYGYAEHGFVTFADVFHDAWNEDGTTPDIDFFDGADWKRAWRKTEGMQTLEWIVDHLGDDWGFDKDNRYLRAITWGADLGIDLYLAAKIQTGGWKVGTEAVGKPMFQLTNKKLVQTSLRERGGTMSSLARWILINEKKTLEAAAIRNRKGAGASLLEEWLQADRAARGLSKVDIDDPTTGIPKPRKKSEPKKKGKELDKVSAKGRAKDKGLVVDDTKPAKSKEELAEERTNSFMDKVEEDAPAESVAAGVAADDAASADAIFDGVPDEPAATGPRRNFEDTGEEVDMDDLRGAKDAEAPAPEEPTGKPTPEDLDEVTPPVEETIASTYTPIKKKLSFPKKKDQAYDTDLGNGYRIMWYEDVDQNGKSYWGANLVDGNGDFVHHLCDEDNFVKVKARVREYQQNGYIDEVLQEKGTYAPEPDYPVDTNGVPEPTDEDFINDLEREKADDEAGRRRWTPDEEEVTGESLKQEISNRDSKIIEEALAAIERDATFDDWPDVLSEGALADIREGGVVARREYEEAMARVHELAHADEVIDEFAKRVRGLAWEVRTSMSGGTKKVALELIFREAAEVAKRYGFKAAPVYARWAEKFKARARAARGENADFDPWQPGAFVEEVNQFISDITDIAHFEINPHLPDEVVDLFMTSQNQEVAQAVRIFERVKQCDELGERGIYTIVVAEGGAKLKGKRGNYRVVPLAELNAMADDMFARGLLDRAPSPRSTDANPRSLGDDRRAGERQVKAEHQYIIRGLQRKRDRWLSTVWALDPIRDSERNVVQALRGIYDTDTKNSLISRANRAAADGDWRAMHDIMDEARAELESIRYFHDQGDTIRRYTMLRKYSNAKRRREASAYQALRMKGTEVRTPSHSYDEFQLVKPWSSERPVGSVDPKKAIRLLQDRKKSLMDQRNREVRRVQSKQGENKNRQDARTENEVDAVLNPGARPGRGSVQGARDVEEIETLLHNTPEWRALTEQIDGINRVIKEIESRGLAADDAAITPEFMELDKHAVAAESGFLPIGTRVEYKYAVRLISRDARPSHVVHRVGEIVDYELDSHRYIVGYRLKPLRGERLEDLADTPSLIQKHKDMSYYPDSGRHIEFRLRESPDLATGGPARGRNAPQFGGYGAYFKVVREGEDIKNIAITPARRIPRRSSGEYMPSYAKDGGVQAYEFAVQYEIDAAMQQPPPQVGRVYSLGEPDIDLIEKGSQTGLFRIESNGKVLRTKPHKMRGRDGKEVPFTYSRGPEQIEFREHVVSAALVELVGQEDFLKLLKRTPEQIVKMARDVSPNPKTIGSFIPKDWDEAIQLYAREKLASEGYDGAVLDVGVPNSGNEIFVVNTDILTAPVKKTKRPRKKPTGHEFELDEDKFDDWKSRHVGKKGRRNTSVKTEGRYHPFFKEREITETMTVAQVESMIVNRANEAHRYMTPRQRIAQLRKMSKRLNELEDNRAGWTSLDEYEHAAIQAELDNLFSYLEKDKIDTSVIDIRQEGFNLEQARRSYLLAHETAAQTKRRARAEQRMREALGEETPKQQLLEEAAARAKERERQAVEDQKVLEEDGFSFEEFKPGDEIPAELMRQPGKSFDDQMADARRKALDIRRQTLLERVGDADVAEYWPIDVPDFGSDAGFGRTTPEILSRRESADAFRTRFRAASEAVDVDPGDVAARVGATFREQTAEGVLHGKVAGLTKSGEGKVRPLSKKEWEAESGPVKRFRTHEAYLDDFTLKADLLVRTGRKRAGDFMIPGRGRKGAEQRFASTDKPSDRLLRRGRYAGRSDPPEEFAAHPPKDKAPEQPVLDAAETATAEALSSPKTMEGFRKKVKERTPDLTKEEADALTQSGIEITPEALDFNAEHLLAAKRIAEANGVEFEVVGQKKVTFDKMEFDVPEYIRISGKSDNIHKFVEELFQWQPDPEVPALRALPAMFRTKAEMIAYETTPTSNHANYIAKVLGLPDPESCPQMLPYVKRLEQARHASGKAERGKNAPEGVLDVLTEMEKDPVFKALFVEGGPGMIDPTSAGLFSHVRARFYEDSISTLQHIPIIGNTMAETFRIMGTPIALERALPLYDKPTAIKNMAYSTKMGRKKMDEKARAQARRHEQEMFMAGGDTGKIRDALQHLEDDIRTNLAERGLLDKFDDFSRTINRHRAATFVKTNTKMSRAYDEWKVNGQEFKVDRVLNPELRDAFKKEMGSISAQIATAKAAGDKATVALLEARLDKAYKKMQDVGKQMRSYLGYINRGEAHKIPPKLAEEVTKYFHSEPVHAFQFASDFSTSMNFRYLAWFQSGRPVAWYMKWIDSTWQEHWMRLFKTMVMGTLAFPIRVMAGDELWRLPMEGLIPGSKRWKAARNRAMLLRGGVDPQSYLFGRLGKRLNIGLDKTILTKAERAEFHRLQGEISQIQKDISINKKRIDELATAHHEWLNDKGKVAPTGRDPDAMEYRALVKETDKLLDMEAKFNAYDALTQPLGGRTAMNVMAEKNEMDMANFIDEDNFMMIGPEAGHPDYPAALSDWFGQFAKEPLVQIWKRSSRPHDYDEIVKMITDALKSDTPDGRALREALYNTHRIKAETVEIGPMTELLDKMGKKGHLTVERYNLDNIIGLWANSISRVVKTPDLEAALLRGSLPAKQVAAMMRANRHGDLWTIPMTSAWRYGGHRTAYYMNFPARYYQHATLPLLGYLSRKTREMLFADRINRYLDVMPDNLGAEAQALYLKMSEERAAGWVNKSTFTRTSTIFEDVSRNVIPFLNSYRQFWVYWTKMLFTKPLTMGVLSTVPEGLNELSEEFGGPGLQLGPFNLYLQSFVPFFLQTAPGEEPTQGIFSKDGKRGMVENMYALPNIEPIMATMLGSLFKGQTGESLENMPFFESSGRSLAPFSRYGLLLEGAGIDLGRLTRDADNLHSRWYNIKRSYMNTGKVAMNEKNELPFPLGLLEKNPVSGHNPMATVQWLIGTFSPISANYSPEFPGNLMKEQAKFYEIYKKDGELAAQRYLNKTKYWQYLYEYKNTASWDRKKELADEMPWLPNFSGSNYNWKLGYAEPFNPTTEREIKDWEDVAKSILTERVGMYGGWETVRGEPVYYPGDSAKRKIFGQEARKHTREMRDYAKSAALVHAKGNKKLAEEYFNQWERMTPGLVDYLQEGTIPTWQKDALMPYWYEQALKEDGLDPKLWHPGLYMSRMVSALGRKNDYKAPGFTLPPNESDLESYQNLVGAGVIPEDIQERIQNGYWGETIRDYQRKKEEEWAGHQVDLLTDRYYDIDVNNLEQLTGMKFGKELEDAIRDVRLAFFQTLGSDEWKAANPVGSDGYKRGRQLFYKYKDDRMKGVNGGELFIGGAPERLLTNPYLMRVKTQFVGPDAESNQKKWNEYLKEARKDKPDMQKIEAMKRDWDQQLMDKWEDRQKVNDWVYVAYKAKAMRTIMMESWSDYYDGPGNSVHTKMGERMVVQLERIIKEQMQNNTIFKSNIKSLFDNNPRSLAWHLLDWYNY